MKRNPTRLELRNAVNDAYDFITTNLEAAEPNSINDYSKTLEVLGRFGTIGKLARYPERTKSTVQTSD